MDLITDYIEPAELTGFVRADLDAFHANEDNAFLLQWFPIEQIDDVDYKYAKGGELESAVASYRTYDAESPVGSRPGSETVRGTIPPISEKIPLSEYENLRRRNSSTEAIRNVGFRDATRQGRRIARRLELARGQMLTESKITINENGLVTEFVFDRDATHTTTPSVAWGTSATADPVLDLSTWRDRVEAKGFRVETILASREAVNAARRTKAVIDAVKGSAAGVSQVSLDELNSLLNSEGLPGFTVSVSTVGGTRTIGTKNIIMLPGAGDGIESICGRTVFGTTAEAVEAAYELDLDNGEAPGVVSGQYKSQDPVTIWTKTAAVAVPLFAEPNSTLAAQVLA